jgi:hypothetical protein
MMKSRRFNRSKSHLIRPAAQAAAVLAAGAIAAVLSMDGCLSAGAMSGREQMQQKESSVGKALPPDLTRFEMSYERCSHAAK